jgi:hypothetical protein
METQMDLKQKLQSPVPFFPSNVAEICRRALLRIEELEAAVDDLSAYEAENARLWTLVELLVREVPATSEAYHKAQRILAGEQE